MTNQNIFPMFAVLDDCNQQSILHKETQNKGVVGGFALCFKSLACNRLATATPAYINNWIFQMLDEKNNYTSANNSNATVTDNSRNELIIEATNDLLAATTTKELTEVLTNLFINWVDHTDCPSHTEKEKVVFNTSQLINFIKQIEL